MRHFYKTIPGWCSFTGVYEDAVREAKSPAVFVEVGAWKGRSASFMGVEIANSGKRISFYAVDHWKGSDEAAHHADPDVRRGRLFEVFLRNTAPVRAYVNPLRMSSVEAAATFADGSVDFVLLDGGHTYEDVMADFAAWLPKLKPGGTIAGDDWNWSGVNKAVKETFTEGRYEILGEGKGRHWRVRCVDDDAVIF